MMWIRCRRRGRHAVLAAAVLALTCQAACLGALEWDGVRAPCAPEDAACLPGYSCMPADGGGAPGCVRHGSIAVGDPCAGDAMCEQGGVCFDGACAPPCAAPGAYLEAGACAVGSVCMPAADGGRGACLPAHRCLAGSRCSAPGVPQGGVCVALDVGSALCLPAGTPRWDAEGTYGDDCGPGQACQLIGRAPEQQLVCMPSGVPGQRPGRACGNPVALPCAPGQICRAGRCAELCDLHGSARCTAPARCTAVGLAAGEQLLPRVGVCALP